MGFFRSKSVRIKFFSKKKQKKFQKKIALLMTNEMLKMISTRLYIDELGGEEKCIGRELSFCRGVLPYATTLLPNWVGDANVAERNLSVPYFEIISESQCHPRIQQYACAVLEPPCRAGVAVPPCRNFCRGILSRIFFLTL